MIPVDTSLLAFLAAALVVLVIPGPGVLYVVARSVGQGRESGLVSAAGLSVGALVHVAAATAGMSALLVTSATAFSLVKFLGAAYLIYLGVRTVVGASSTPPREAPPPRSLACLFRDGVIVSVLNPKIAIFFLAFLPQFTDPTLGSVPMQVFLLGLLYCLLALITDSCYALLADQLRRRFGPRFGHNRWATYATGTVYVGLGVGTALVEQH